MFNAISKAGPSDSETTTLVRHLRSSVIPTAEHGTNMIAHVGGSTAGYDDLASRISSKLPLQIIVVIALSFILLILAFRTVVIPPQAALMNLLSIGAAYGVLIAIFQYGWLSGLIGLNGSVPIVSYVPLFMFAILFGLSMDYEVFLVSQIDEHHSAGEDNDSAVVSGLVTSARVITSAAAIMVFVFGSFVLNGDPTIKQFGVGLAVAVILDATVVRCLLVPGADAAGGRAQLVHAALARPLRTAHQHRGRGVLRTGCGARAAGGRARRGGSRLSAADPATAASRSPGPRATRGRTAAGGRSRRRSPRRRTRPRRA